MSIIGNSARCKLTIEIQEGKNAQCGTDRES